MFVFRYREPGSLSVAWPEVRAAHAPTDREVAAVNLSSDPLPTPTPHPGRRPSGVEVGALTGVAKWVLETCQCACIYMYIYIYIYTHVFAYARVLTETYIRAHTEAMGNIHKHIHLYTHMHSYLCTCIYTHAYIRTYTYI